MAISQCSIWIFISGLRKTPLSSSSSAFFGVNLLSLCKSCRTSKAPWERGRAGRTPAAFLPPEASGTLLTAQGFSWRVWCLLPPASAQAVSPSFPPGRSLRRAGWAESCQPQLESYKACVSDLDATNLSNHLKPSQIALLSVHLVKSPGGLFF